MSTTLAALRLMVNTAIALDGPEATIKLKTLKKLLS